MFSFTKNEFLFLSEEGFWIWVWFGTERDGLDWAVTPFSDGDCRVFVLHIDVVEWGRILVTVSLQDCELRESEHSIDKVFIPQKPRVNPWPRFILIIEWGSRILESGTGIDWERDGRGGEQGSGIILSFSKEGLNKFGNRVGSGGMGQLCW
jgi:hypothetical protein